MVAGTVQPAQDVRLIPTTAAAPSAAAKRQLDSSALSASVTLIPSGADMFGGPYCPVVFPPTDPHHHGGVGTRNVAPAVAVAYPSPSEMFSVNAVISAAKADVESQQLASRVSVVALENGSKRPLPLRIKEINSNGDVRYHEADSPEPFHVESDQIHNGQAILKVRTAQWDRRWTNPYESYFKGRQRMLEIMVQMQLKHISPDERVYIGIESTSPAKMNNIFAKAAAKAVMALVEATVPFAHTTLGQRGKENCCLVFPLHTTADRFVATPPGETPPPLGVDMFDDSYSPDRRPKFSGIYHEDWTYSFSFHSMYVDLVCWRLVNLPTMDDISLNTFFKGIPVRFVGYALPKNHQGPHRQQDKRYLFAFELENDRHKMV